MRKSECPREADLLEALQTSAWPECCGHDLRAHVDACVSCRELVDVVLPLLQEHRIATLEAPVPSSARVWWRAQMRARQEAAETAGRPIRIVQGLSMACAAGVLAAIGGYLSPAFRQIVAGLWSVPMEFASTELPTIAWSDTALSTPLGIAVILAVTMVLLVAPVAIYLAISED